MISPARRPLGRVAKRVFDLTLLLLAIVPIGPIMGAVALYIYAVDGAPVIYRQSRIGLGNRPFTIYKFRTMVKDAQLSALGTVTVAKDPRLLPGAGIIRKLKLDELPQLFGVLSGTMSLVGPRPTVTDDTDRMSVDQLHRHDVLPGLTGLAQVRGHASLIWPRRIEFDLEYAAHWSLWLDIKILIRTFLLVLTGGADTPPLCADEWTEAETSPPDDRAPTRD